MALINDAMKSSEGPAPQGAGPATPPEGGQQGLGPEKDAMVAKAYKLGKNILYRKDVFSQFMAQLDSEPPVAVMAEAIVMILEKVNDSMGLPIDVLLATGLALVADLTEMLNQTGRVQLSADDVTQAVQMGVEMFLETNGSKLDQNELMQAAQSMAQQVPGGM